jgi:MSHA biogenesis protein MshO
MGREIRKSLPNSVVTSVGQCVSFIPTKTGGRYRADDTAAGLDFSVADTTFNMLGSNAALPADQRIAPDDIIVVYNLGIAGASAYSSNNTSVISSVGPETGTPLETPLTFASKQFPLASPNNRFYVVPFGEQVVSYVCSGGNLRRTVTTLAGSTCGVTGPIIARNVSNCIFDYSGSDLQRNALVRMSLQLTENGETVSLQHEVHINNTP